MTVREIKARLAVAGLNSLAIWRGCDGQLRVGHSGDVATMLDDLKILASY